MTCRWLISSSLLWILAVPTLGAANVSGRVELADSRDEAVRKKRDYSGVVIWLEPLGHKVPVPPPQTFTMLQKGKRFQPHILAIPLGATVDFPNLDPIFHNAFSNFAGQPFDTGLYRPGSTQKIQFRRDGVVRVFCNIHASMSAVILVLKTPYIAVTGADGKYSIDGVEPGEYRFHVWHERASTEALSKLEKTVAVRNPIDLGALRVSESGYLEIPHRNKYDRDYPPEPADSLYPGGRK